MTAESLTYKHFCYQDSILEGNTDIESVKSGYEHWSGWCVVTAITPAYIKVELPDKTLSSQRPVSYYADYEVNDGC